MKNFFNPLYIFKIIEDKEKLQFFLVMLAPFVGIYVEGKFSFFLAAISLWAFFRLVILILEDDGEDEAN